MTWFTYKHMLLRIKYRVLPAQRRYAQIWSKTLQLVYMLTSLRTSYIPLFNNYSPFLSQNIVKIDLFYALFLICCGWSDNYKEASWCWIITILQLSTFINITLSPVVDGTGHPQFDLYMLPFLCVFNILWLWSALVEDKHESTGSLVGQDK